jgi:hypothetical protein
LGVVSATGGLLALCKRLILAQISE